MVWPLMPPWGARTHRAAVLLLGLVLLLLTDSSSKTAASRRFVKSEANFVRHGESCDVHAQRYDDDAPSARRKPSLSRTNSTICFGYFLRTKGSNPTPP
ncbi:hypothetical protein T484DRAFT_1831449 [Baffinella frigidus]|nr:hypothetical protein T484DRAFT_1831449 [Cryptophyta sp. CCMP2293]